MDPICTVDECSLSAFRRGLCHRHLYRLVRLGSVTAPLSVDRFEPIESRLDRKSDRSAGWLGCWPWKVVAPGHRYGVLRFQGRMLTAHRAAYEVAYGPIPEGLVVCHSCDNPPCVNPAHLFVGTQADNVTDMRLKRRHPLARLTDQDLFEIIRLRAAGEPRQQVAERFGISPTYVWEVCSGKAASGRTGITYQPVHRVARCGTKSGWTSHRRRGEDPCADCVAGMRAANRKPSALLRDGVEAARLHLEGGKP